LQFRKNQAGRRAGLKPFPGSADTGSVDPNLHLVVHAKVGEKQLGFAADRRLL